MLTGIDPHRQTLAYKPYGLMEACLALNVDMCCKFHAMACAGCVLPVPPWCTSYTCQSLQDLLCMHPTVGYAVLLHHPQPCCSRCHTSICTSCRPSRPWRLPSLRHCLPPFSCSLCHQNASHSICTHFEKFHSLRPCHLCFVQVWNPAHAPCAVLAKQCGFAGALTKASISFTPAVASVFCWVDLRSALPEATWEAERQLWEEGFVQRCGFIITPGMESEGIAVPTDQS